MPKSPQFEVGQTKASRLRGFLAYSIARDCVLDLVNMSGKTCFTTQNSQV